MKQETGPTSRVIVASCDGSLPVPHPRINLSGLDNKFRTVDAAIAKKLEAKGFNVYFDSQGGYYEIAQAPPEAGEFNATADANFHTGSAFWQSGQRRKAMEVWEENVRRFPRHRDSWYNLGLAYLRDHEYERAINCLKQAINTDPSDGQAWWYLGYAYRLMGEESESRQAYAKAKALGWQQPPM